MRKFFSWMLSGALAVALMVVLKEVFRIWTPSMFPPGSLLGLSLPPGGASILLWEMLWGAAYGVFFYLVAQRVLPKTGPGPIVVFALILFLVTVLAFPMLRKIDLSAAITPAMLVRAGLACAFYSAVTILLGRQMEK